MKSILQAICIFHLKDKDTHTSGLVETPTSLMVKLCVHRRLRIIQLTSQETTMKIGIPLAQFKLLFGKNPVPGIYPPIKGLQKVLQKIIVIEVKDAIRKD